MGLRAHFHPTGETGLVHIPLLGSYMAVQCEVLNFHSQFRLWLWCTWKGFNLALCSVFLIWNNLTGTTGGNYCIIKMAQGNPETLFAHLLGNEKWNWTPDPASILDYVEMVQNWYLPRCYFLYRWFSPLMSNVVYMKLNVMMTVQFIIMWIRSPLCHILLSDRISITSVTESMALNWLLRTLGEFSYSHRRRLFKSSIWYA